jgi:ATPase subunit of ABC transporter with duplicated ATPase domains
MPIHHQVVEIARPEFLGGGQWRLSRLNAVNVVLGRNGCGKSQLLRTLRDRSMAASHYVVPERTGEIQFEAGLMVEVLDANRRRERSRGNFSSNYRQEVVTRIQS